ncbi:MAG TPA: cob(I)yrinic acid a,c-diamide adenosyltransferase [Candidatus Paceibacterota bacterium]|nr:cob(I)yrinic acid a,c-diamide adenosyltransferase [Verrucomicrobiota bacterium]HRY47106.1 cob(I)yrinic acid a,c-diamide adenosyltransferase [Candidatus Paceibacterota bacterium]HSA02192.1 cob(I)yrinic acid a,c-diamide adenosyltransferase [Candidatus Paceibacterota bacterium]
MSIATKNGDSGQTRLMYQRPIAKCHPRVEAYGSVDELNSALGMARAIAPHAWVRAHLLEIQRDLITLMGELATAEQDLVRFGKDGFGQITPKYTEKLDRLIQEVEAQVGAFKGWAIPGDQLHTAALDLARTTCRRAERRVCALRDAQDLANAECIVYLNRLGDLLWLLARWEEQHPEKEP